jgi:hypothetical protein
VFKKGTIDKLKKGDANKSDIERGVTPACQGLAF